MKLSPSMSMSLPSPMSPTTSPTSGDVQRDHEKRRTETTTPPTSENVGKRPGAASTPPASEGVRAARRPPPDSPSAGLKLQRAFFWSLGLHLLPLAAWLAFAWITPRSKPENTLNFDTIGIIAQRQQEARQGTPPPPPPPPQAAPPKAASASSPPSRAAPPPRPDGVQLPTQAQAAPAPPPSPPPEAAQKDTATEAEESRVAQRLAEKQEVERAIRRQYMKEMGQKVDRHLRYPLASRLAGETGMPEVSFTVTLAGGIHSLRISKSSGYPDLDEAALAAIRHSAPFAPPPFGKETEITMSLNFEKRTPENSG